MVVWEAVLQAKGLQAEITFNLDEFAFGTLCVVALVHRNFTFSAPFNLLNLFVFRSCLLDS